MEPLMYAYNTPARRWAWIRRGILGQIGSITTVLNQHDRSHVILAKDKEKLINIKKQLNEVYNSIKEMKKFTDLPNEIRKNFST